MSLLELACVCMRACLLTFRSSFLEDHVLPKKALLVMSNIVPDMCTSTLKFFASSALSSRNLGTGIWLMVKILRENIQHHRDSDHRKHRPLQRIRKR